MGKRDEMLGAEQTRHLCVVITLNDTLRAWTVNYKVFKTDAQIDALISLCYDSAEIEVCCLLHISETDTLE